MNERWPTPAAVISAALYRRRASRRELDVFGSDRARPLARLDHAGLLGLLNGRKPVVLSAETTMMIETPTGAHQRYQRRPAEVGTVLAWEQTGHGRS